MAANAWEARVAVELLEAWHENELGLRADANLIRTATRGRRIAT